MFHLERPSAPGMDPNGATWSKPPPYQTMRPRCSTWNIHRVPGYKALYAPPGAFTRFNGGKSSLPHLERLSAPGMDPNGLTWSTPGGTRQ